MAHSTEQFARAIAQCATKYKSGKALTRTYKSGKATFSSNVSIAAVIFLSFSDATAAFLLDRGLPARASQSTPEREPIAPAPTDPPKVRRAQKLRIEQDLAAVK